MKLFLLPGLAFEAWDESHSGVKVLQKAVAADPEIQKVEDLLVTGKKTSQSCEIPYHVRRLPQEIR